MGELAALALSTKWDTNGRNAATAAAAARHSDLQALILHAGQDYGGQGARWAAASGKCDLTTVYLAAGQDTAGIGSRYAELAARYDHLTIRAAHRSQTYLDYPYDILWGRNEEGLVRRLAEEADVVHLNDRTYAYTELRLERQHKPALLHHHGAAYRHGATALNAQARRYGMVQAVSTIDLLRYGDRTVWLPAPFDVDALVALGEANRRPEDGRILVAQSPTNRELKSTDKLEAAVASLKQEGLPVDLVVIERMAWRDALPLKARADIFFDQVQLGYGCSAIEAWGMGMPVIAGGDAWTEAKMREVFGTKDLPFYKAEDDVESIREAIRALARSDRLRAKWARRGAVHVRRFHDEVPALGSLVELYFQALGTTPEPSEVRPDLSHLKQGPGTFRSPVFRSLTFYSSGVAFRFAAGRLEADAYHAPMVRAFMALRPEHQITEDEGTIAE